MSGGCDHFAMGFRIHNHICDSVFGERLSPDVFVLLRSYLTQQSLPRLRRSASTMQKHIVEHMISLFCVLARRLPVFQQSWHRRLTLRDTGFSSKSTDITIPLVVRGDVWPLWSGRRYDLQPTNRIMSVWCWWCRDV